MKDPLSARPPSSDDRRTFESVLDSARKKLAERNYNGAVEDCKVAISILKTRTPSMAIQHSISECLETMADAYFADKHHEYALSKYEEAFQIRGKVFQRVEKPMMELLFKLEKTLSALVASGHIEKFNETENRWKAFVLSPPPGRPMVIDDSIIPGQDAAELQQLWKRVVKKQKSEVRMTKLLNRFSMPSLVIPGIIVFVLLIAVPLCFFYIKGATDAAKDKADTVDSTKVAGGTSGADTDDSPDKASKTGDHGTSTGTGSSTGASTSTAPSSGLSSSSSSTAHIAAATGAGSGSQTTKSEIKDWYENLKRGSLGAREFATADKNLDWQFSPDKTVHIKYSGGAPSGVAPTGTTMSCDFYADGGNLSDWLELFQRSVFHKCYWLSVARFGLMDAGGTNYFDTSSPEYGTIQQMARLAVLSRDFNAMKKQGGDNVTFRPMHGNTADSVITTLKPELGTKKAFSILCINLIDLKKKNGSSTSFVIGLDHNKNLIPAGRGGRNYVMFSDVDYSKAMVPEQETVVVTDNSVQQSRFRSVMLLFGLATAFLLLSLLMKPRQLKLIGVVIMVALIILTLIALANTLQSIGLQKVR